MMKELIHDCRTIYENKRNHFNFFERIYNKLEKPTWMINTNDKRLECIYEHQDLLYTEGRIVFAQIVQANNLLFKPGKSDHPACVVFSEDIFFDEKVYDLYEIAHSMFELKDTSVDDPDLKIFSDAITDEMTTLFNLQLPIKITNNRVVYYSTIMVCRKHLPTKYLTSGWFPLLTNQNKTKASMILPSKYWPKQLIKKWIE